MKFLGNRISIEYEVFGPEGAPVVMLSHSLGSSSVMWAPQLPKLAESFRVVCMDTRGHGGTAAPEGEYSLDMLGDDALALMDGLEMHQVRAEKVHDIKTDVKIVYFTQLLGLALGLSPRKVGLHENISDSLGFFKQKGLA